MIRSLLPLFTLALLGAGACSSPEKSSAEPPAPAEDPRVKVTVQAEDAAYSSDRMKVMEHAAFASGKGIILADGAASHMDKPDRNAPDATFTFNVAAPGRYWVVSRAATVGDLRKAMAKAASKYDSPRIRLAVDNGIIRERVLISPWENQDGTTRRLLRTELGVGTHMIRVWLPKECALDTLELEPYDPPAVPEGARNYQPKIVPPAAHPRIWATPETLPQIRANLTAPTHAPVWAEVQKEAAKPFRYTAAVDAEAEYDGRVQVAAEAKAFVYLMTGDKTRGREAVELMTAYLGAIEFGNMLDITRELGSAIYTGALVYDWCYDLLTDKEEKILRTNLLRLAEDMEIGWPPFLEPIVYGHGNELQVNRDLLAMSIALYGKDTVPYRYCSWLILEQLVPMRAFEYVSNRHNQGVGYGNFRFGAEMRGAWMMRRMCGHEVFDPNIKTLGWYWLYYLRPDGAILPEGDGSLDSGPWSSGDTLFLIYSYAADPVFKAEFLREKAVASDNTIFLTLDDPALAAADPSTLEKLPLTHYFRPPIPGMIARTGWQFGEYSNDALVSMQGGDTHFGNHQHMDAGNFQIFYRGMIVCDLGMYGFYGTPYDMGFNKRSIAHSVMLLYDPNDRWFATNDGGMRLNQTCPKNVEETKKPSSRLGKVIADFVGPDPQRPVFSYLKNDLAPAYYGKAKDYFRTYCFVNLGLKDHPGVLLVVDRVTPAKPDIREYWSVNTLGKPEPTERGIVVRSLRDVMPGKVTLSMFLPREWNRETVGGDDGSVSTVFGKKLTPPSRSSPQARGYRTTFSPTESEGTDIYAAALVIGDDSAPELPVNFIRADDRVIFQLPGRTVVLSTTALADNDSPAGEDGRTPIPSAVSMAARGAFQLHLPEPSLVFVDGVAPGPWRAAAEDGGASRVFQAADNGTLLMELDAGDYRVVLTPGTPVEPMPKTTAPERPRPEPGVYVGSRKIAAPTSFAQGELVMVPAKELLAEFGADVKVTPQELTAGSATGNWKFRPDDRHFMIDGRTLTAPAAPVIKDGNWYLPDCLAAAVGGRAFSRDPVSANALFSAGPVENGGLLWLESNCGMTVADWLLITRNDLSKGANYWAACGKGSTFTASFIRPQFIDAVGITWLSGNTRTAFFKLEIFDGETWKTVHDGDSRKTAEMEYYEFPKQPVLGVRFTGNGNTTNAWNSIIQFRLRDAK